MTSPLVLNGRYRLDERLATGGMGEVWQATDELLGRSVAVKLLKEEYLTDESFRGRFRAEARFAASLQHSGIAQVFDYGEQDDLAYLVMELVPGETLSRILSVEGRLSVDTALDIIGQAARALQVAHAAGIIHRDIKPANIMVTSDGTVKITDFGIARGGASVTTTQTGQVMGTAQYVSPEQATGRTITPSSDLYSLGVVAYECLAGMPPFEADTPIALALMHVREEAPPLPADVPPAVRGLVSAMMANDPEDRPENSREVADQVQDIRREAGRLGGVGAATQKLDAAGTAPSTRVQEPVSEGPATHRTAVADGERRVNRIVVLVACAAILLGTGVFAVGALWKSSGHTKLVDGNRVASASPTPSSPRTQAQDSPVPSNTPEPSESTPADSGPTPTESPTTPVPTTSPTPTTKPPKRTPTPTHSPPASPTAPPASGSPGPLGSEPRA